MSDKRVMKRFVCYWGEGYTKEGTVEIVWIHHFNNDLGYTDEMIEKVSELDIHDVADLTEMWAHHVVLRVK